MRKYKNFIKKTLIIFLALFLISGQVTAFARAGGGGGSSGGGGGASGGSGGSSSGSDSRSRSSLISFGNSGVSVDPIGLLIFLVTISAGTITFKVKLSKKKFKSISTIKKLSKEDKAWNYKNIIKDIEEAFYNIQDAWMERNQDLAKEYMSEDLYSKHKCQTEWMKIRKEKNILKNVILLSAKPIGVRDYEDTTKDSLWVYIKAKSIDYVINEETNKVIKGRKYIPTRYEEYWKFINRDAKWILDEIRQIDDVEDLDFFNIEVKK